MLFGLLSVSTYAREAKTPIFTGKVTLDNSKSENLAKDQNPGRVEKLKKFTRSFANEGTASTRPLEFDSLTNGLTPVLDSAKYNYYFKFNLKAEDGKLLNCEGMTDKKFEIYSAGCSDTIR